MRSEDRERPGASGETGSGLPLLPPGEFVDPVIEAYKKDVDRTLIRENLKLTYRQRLRKLERAAAAAIKWQGAAQRISAPKRSG